MNRLAAIFLFALCFVGFLGCFVGAEPDLVHNIYIDTQYTAWVTEDWTNTNLKISFAKLTNITDVTSFYIKSLWETVESDLTSPTNVVNLTLWNSNSVGNNSNLIALTYLNGDLSNLFTLQLALNFSVNPNFNDSRAPIVNVNVLVSNYTWQSNSTDAQLVLTWAYDHSFNGTVVPNIDVALKSSRSVNVDEAYLTVNTTAYPNPFDKANSVKASLALANKVDGVAADSKDLYLAIQNFQGAQITETVEIGYGAASGSSSWLIIIIIIIIVILVVCLVAVIAFVLMRQRRRAYDTF